MGIIKDKVVGAFEKFRKDKLLYSLIKSLINIADHNVHYQWHRDILDEAVKEEWANTDIIIEDKEG